MASTSAGSTGIGGSPDRVAVLARGRGEADGELSITGRDVTEEARVRHLRVAHIRQYALPAAAPAEWLLVPAGVPRTSGRVNRTLPVLTTLDRLCSSSSLMGDRACRRGRFEFPYGQAFTASPWLRCAGSAAFPTERVFFPL